MARQDYQLLSEAYEEAKVKSFIVSLYEEGKTEKEIEAILTEAGLWDRFKSKVKAYNPFDKESRENLKKVGMGKFGGLAQKGLKKAGEKLGIDPDAIESSTAFKKAQEAEMIGGREGESAIRSSKLKNMLQYHLSDIEDIANKTIETKKETEEGFRKLFDQIKEDLKKLNIGKANIAKLDKDLNSLASSLPDSIGSQYTDPKMAADYVITKITDFFNKMKTAKGQGLQKAHRVDPTKLR